MLQRRVLDESFLNLISGAVIPRLKHLKPRSLRQQKDVKFRGSCRRGITDESAGSPASYSTILPVMKLFLVNSTHSAARHETLDELIEPFGWLLCETSYSAEIEIGILVECRRLHSITRRC